MADPDQRKIGEVFKQFVQTSKLAQSVQMQASQTMSAVSTHVREIVPQTYQEIADFAKKTISNIGNFFKGLWEDVGRFFGIFGEDDLDKQQLEEQEKQTSWLQKIFNLFKEQQKAQLREYEPGEKKGGLKGILALGLIGIVGAVIGAFIRTIILPIELLLKTPGIRAIAKVLKPFKNLLINIIRWGEDIPILGRLLKGAKAGFRILGWPLTLLLGVIDFVRGFMATEGTLFDKIKGGFTVAIMKFLELPIRALGWVLEKLGLEDATAKIAAVFRNTIGLIFDLMYSAFKGIADMVQMFPWDAITTVIKSVADFFLTPFKMLWDFIKESKIIKWLASRFGGLDIEKEDPFAVEALTKGAKAREIELGKIQAETPETAVADLYDARKKEAEETRKSQKEMKQSVDNLSDKIDKLTEVTGEGQTNLAMTMSSQKTEEAPKEPPANQENLGMLLTNMTF